jgi:hypothetical protein
MPHFLDDERLNSEAYPTEQAEKLGPVLERYFVKQSLVQLM